MNKKIGYTSTFFCLLFAIFTHTVAAEPSADGVDINQFDFFTRFSSISALVNVLLPNVLILAGIILMVYTVIGGLGMIRSAGSGDSEGAQKGKQALTYGILGFVIIFTAALAIQLIEYLTGVPIFNPGF